MCPLFWRTIIWQLKLQKQTQNYRRVAREGFQFQAEKMKKNSSKEVALVAVDKTVTVPILEVDRGHTDLRNVLAVVMEVKDDGLYRLPNLMGIW